MLDFGPQLSVTLTPLIPKLGGTIHAAVQKIAPLGFRSVQLSAAQKGIRARELDKRARRDVLALLSRQGLMLSGLDLMIRHGDFLDPATQDRAVTAVIEAMELAHDFGSVPLSITLPVEKLGDDVKKALVAAADGRGVTLAVHGEHDIAALKQWTEAVDQPALGAAMDPAAVLAEGRDVPDTAVELARTLRVARLDDYATTSMASAGGRCAVGRGELDVLGYRAALSTATKLRAIVVELRDLADPVSAAKAALSKWAV
jgi:sugar phosphate isomerase/epimerase